MKIPKKNQKKNGKKKRKNPQNAQLRLMKLNSTSLSPETRVVRSFSRPARSTKKTSEVITVLSPPWRSTLNLYTVWPVKWLWNGCEMAETSVEICWNMGNLVRNPLKSTEIWWENVRNLLKWLKLFGATNCSFLFGSIFHSWWGWVNIQDWNPIEIDRLEAFDLFGYNMFGTILGPFWIFIWASSIRIDPKTGSTYRTSGGLRVHGSGRHCLTARGIFDDAQACIQGLHWLIHSMFQINPELRMNMNFWIPLVRMVAPKNKEYSL